MSVLSIGSGLGAGRKSARSLAGKRWEATFKTSLEYDARPLRDHRSGPRRKKGTSRISKYAYAEYLRWARTPTWIVKRSLGADCSTCAPAHRSSGLFEMYCHTLDSGEPLVLDGFSYEDDWGGELKVRWIRHSCQQARRRTRLYLA